MGTWGGGSRGSSPVLRAGPDRQVLGAGYHRRPRPRHALLGEGPRRQGIQVRKARRGAGQPPDGLRRQHRHPLHVLLLRGGGAADRVCVGDLVDQADLHDLLFLVDRGFYSEENLALFTSGGSNYIISLPEMLVEARKVKAAKRHGVWVACNCKKRRVELFEKLNPPLKVLPKC